MDTEDDDEIDKLIESELQALDGESLCDELEDEEFTTDIEETYKFDASFSQYLSLIRSNEKNAEEKVFVAKDIIEELDKVSLNMEQLLERRLQEVLYDDYGDQVMSVHSEVISYLERNDLQDEKDLNSTMIGETDLTANVIRPGVIDEIRELEEAAKEKLDALHKAQKEQVECNRMADEKKHRDAEMFQTQIQEKREEKQQEFVKLQELFQKQQMVRTETLAKDLAQKEKEIQKFQHTVQEVIENNLQVEKERLKELQDEFTKNEKERQINAALLIQKNFKRYLVQKLYESELVALKRKREEKAEEKRVLLHKQESRRQIEEKRKRIEKIRAKQEKLDKEKEIEKMKKEKKYNEENVNIRGRSRKTMIANTNVSPASLREPHRTDEGKVKNSLQNIASLDSNTSQLSSNNCTMVDLHAQEQCKNNYNTIVIDTSNNTTEIETSKDTTVIETSNNSHDDEIETVNRQFEENIEIKNNTNSNPFLDTSHVEVHEIEPCIVDIKLSSEIHPKHNNDTNKIDSVLSQNVTMNVAVEDNLCRESEKISTASINKHDIKKGLEHEFQNMFEETCVQCDMDTTQSQNVAKRQAVVKVVKESRESSDSFSALQKTVDVVNQIENPSFDSPEINIEDSKPYNTVCTGEIGGIDGGTDSNVATGNISGMNGRTDSNVTTGGISEMDGRTDSNVATGNISEMDNRTDSNVITGGISEMDGRTDSNVITGGISKMDGRTDSNVITGGISEMDGRTDLNVATGNISEMDNRTDSNVITGGISEMDGRTDSNVITGGISEMDGRTDSNVATGNISGMDGRTDSNDFPSITRHTDDALPSHIVDQGILTNETGRGNICVDSRTFRVDSHFDQVSLRSNLTTDEGTMSDMNEDIIPSNMVELFHAWFVTHNRMSLAHSTIERKMEDISMSDVIRKSHANKQCILDHHKKLKCLMITDSEEKFIDGFDQCLSLECLWIQNCQMASFSAHLKHLTILNLQRNNISSMHGFKDLKALVSLDISFNSITRIAALRYCVELQYLNLDGNHIVSLKGLQHLHKLAILSCKNNLVSATDEIHHCTLLREVDLSGNNLTKVPQFENNILLHRLILDENNVTSLENIAEYFLPHLSALSLACNSIQALPTFENLILLKDVNLKNNLLSEASVFQSFLHCGCLEHLCIEGNPVMSLPRARLMISKLLKHLKYIDGEQFEIVQVPITTSKLSELCVRNTMKYVDMKEKLDEILHMNDRNFQGSTITNQIKLWDLLHRMSVLQWNGVYTAEKGDEENNDGARKKKACENLMLVNSVEKEDVSEKHSSSKSREIWKCDEDEKRKESGELKAVVKIQSVYRGYRVRQAYLALREMSLMKDSKADGDSDESDFDYEEKVNLDEFEFNDSVADWQAPATPQIPINAAPLPNIIKNQPTMEKKVKEAWTTPTPSRATSNISQSDSSAVTISPDNDRSSVGSVILSRETEHITKEWGFRSDVTAELMLKRAKRMGVGKKKKAMSPDQRYQLFKKNKDAFAGDISQKRQPVEKHSYFQARGSPTPSTEQLESKQTTYSWVCDQAVLHNERAEELFRENKKYFSGVLTSRSTSKQPHRIESEPLNLPRLEAAVLAGRNIPLIQSEIHNPKPNVKKRSSSGSSKARRVVLSSEAKSHSAPHKRTDSNVKATNEARWKQLSYR